MFRESLGDPIGQPYAASPSSLTARLREMIRGLGPSRERPHETVVSAKVGPLFITIVGLFVGFRLWNITEYSLWLDEISSVEAARMSIAGLLQFAVSEISHPPLFYLLAKGWIAIGGESLLWLKLLPLTFAVLTIIPFYFLCHEMKVSSGAMNLALFLMAVNSFLITYSQEFRMYSLAVLFTVTSLWLFVRFLNTGRGLFALFTVNLLLAYTHYYGLLVVGTEFLFVIFYERKLLTRFTIGLAVMSLLFAPWALLVASRAISDGGVANISWLERPEVKEIVLFYAQLSGIGPSRLLILAGLALFAVPIAWRLLKPDRNVRLLVLAAAVPVAISFVVSQITPVWGLRYLIVSAIPFVLLAAIAIISLPAVQRTITVALIVVWSTSAGVWGFTQVDKIDWAKLADHIRNADRSGATVIAFGSEQTAAPLRFYLDQRFSVQEVDELPDLDRYWVAYRESLDHQVAVLEDEARARGYVVTNVVVDGRPRHQAHIFLVTR